MKKINNQIYCIIEARITSSRLPGKVLKNISKKYKTIDFVINGLIKSEIKKKNIIIAIPNSNSNKKLYKYIKKNYKLKIFKGSEQNVFKRDYDCCKKYKIKNFIRITSDNLFLDPILINQAIKHFRKNNIKYLSSRTMDHSKSWQVSSDYNAGNSIEIVNFSLLRKIRKFVTKKDQEYPTWHIFSKPNFFKLYKFSLIEEYKKKLSKQKIKKIRTTLDTIEDLKFIKKMTQELKLKPGCNNFLKIIENFPKIKKYLAINQKVERKIAYKVVS